MIYQIGCLSHDLYRSKDRNKVPLDLHSTNDKKKTDVPDKMND
jgi:hypothetical protein